MYVFARNGVVHRHRDDVYVTDQYCVTINNAMGITGTVGHGVKLLSKLNLHIFAASFMMTSITDLCHGDAWTGSQYYN
jgi:hypothetical protein